MMGCLNCGCNTDEDFCCDECCDEYNEVEK